MSDFWAEIKNKREQSGKSLKEISDNTNINIKYLLDIENGNFSSVSRTYMRLFLKSYAKEINVDFEELVENTPLNQKPEVIIKENLVDLGIKSKKLNINPKNKSNKLYRIIAIIIFLAIAIVIINRIMNDDEKISKSEIETDTKEMETIDEPKQETIETANIYPLDTVINIVKFPVYLELTPEIDLIYRLDEKDKKLKEELILKDKNHYLTLQSQFKITIYDANKCQLKINNQIIPINKSINKLEFTVDDNGKITVK
ncbi:MAG: helix-turn-helix domain-containing protein [Candidatus Marinimicrobia bacterium]|nr:helix-turn-helix domain-containing protein [Candidatus Neomarinimicrobiota bacterium]